MKHALLALALVALASSAQAQNQNICIDIPTKAITRGENPVNIQTLCEQIRVNVRATEADWGHKQCVEYLTRVGVRIETQNDSSNREKRNRVDVVRQDMGVFDTDWPEANIFTRTYCGDGTVQVDFGEECDPPDGSACDSECKTITP